VLTYLAGPASFLLPKSFETEVMLRITVKENGSTRSLELEGKLSGEWVTELSRYWKENPRKPGVGLQVILKAVSYVDSEGKHLLSEMHASGAEITGCGCMSRALVEEIAGGTDRN
jgi:hypothetical protein